MRRSTHTPHPHLVLPRWSSSVTCLTNPCIFCAPATTPTIPTGTDHHVKMSSKLTLPPHTMPLQLSVSFPTPGTPIFVPSSSLILLDPSRYMSSVAQTPSHGETEKKIYPLSLPLCRSNGKPTYIFTKVHSMEPRSSLGLPVKQWVRC